MTTAADPSTGRPRLRRRDIAVLVILAGTSGAAVIAHAFGPVGMRYSAPFVVLPAAFILVALILYSRGRSGQVAVLSDRLVAGALWGFLATVAYDAIRPIVVWALGFSTDPFKAIPIFGALILDRPAQEGAAIALGWVYHFWNGITFGMMFALVRPRGGWLAGLVWGLSLELFMLAVYPTFIGIRLSDPAFFVTSFVGHATWGLVLGAGLSRWGPR